MYLVSWISVLDELVLAQASSAAFSAIMLVILGWLVVQRRAKKELFQPNWGDAGVIAFGVIQIASTYSGIYHENSLIYGVGVANAAIIYFICRLGGGINSRLLRVFTIGASLLGLTLALADIPMVIERFLEWKQLRLDDIVSFRSAFPLAGEGTRIDRLSLSLALMPYSLFVLIRERYGVIRLLGAMSFIGCTTVIAAGISRGVYLGIISLCLSMLVFGSWNGIKLGIGIQRLLIASTLLVFGTLSICAASTKHLGQNGGETFTSQTRSVVGRFHIWRGTLSHIQDNVMFGVGGDNGALYTLKYGRTASYEPFTSRTYNCMLEVILQNGALGLIAFCVIVVSGLISTARIIRSDADERSRQLALLAQCTLISMLVSDMTYTSIARCTPIMCIFFGLAGMVNSAGKACLEEPPANRPTMMAYYVTIGVLLVTAIYFTAFGLRRRYSESEYLKASEAMRKEEYKNAMLYLSRAESSSDCDALYSSSNGLVLERLADHGLQFREIVKSGPLVSQQHKELLLKAVNAFQFAASCAPMDAMLHNNLGWLYAMLGDQENARVQITEAMWLEPRTALYHLSSGLLYERTGDLTKSFNEYSEAIAFSPGILDSDFFAQLGMRHAKEAPEVINRSISIVEQFPDTVVRGAVLGRFSYEGKDYKAAEKTLVDVLRQLPNLSYAWGTLGRIHEYEGEVNESILDYKRALFTDPLNRIALSGLADADQGTGRYQEGAWAAQTALMIETPSEHAMRVERMYQMPPISGDDVVPLGLLEYTEPKIDVDHLCKIIHEMTRMKERDVPAEAFEQIRVRCAVSPTEGRCDATMKCRAYGGEVVTGWGYSTWNPWNVMRVLQATKDIVLRTFW